MDLLHHEQASSSITIYGKGRCGGKGNGLLVADRVDLKCVDKLRTAILTTDFFERYRDNRASFDAESREILREIHAAFPTPIGVRASERFENDPRVPTSGESTSYMLANNRRDQEQSFDQFLKVIGFIYDRYVSRALATEGDLYGIAIVINPIHGISSSSHVGDIYYPMASGVADSFFRYPLTLDGGAQNPTEGFARIAMGHGYGVVRDDFEVIPVATIRHPLSPALLTSKGQRYFYALRMDEGFEVTPDEMANMSILHSRFADGELIELFRGASGRIDLENLVKGDRYGFMSGLHAIMDQLHRQEDSFQIEFTWNVIEGRGVFHIVQYLSLRHLAMRSFEIPESSQEALIETDQFQGHSVIDGIRYAVVINPFQYQEQMHDDTVAELARLNQELGDRDERYILVCPGRLGTNNRQWGFQLDFGHVSNAAVIVEYGYDIKGSPTLSISDEEMTGGIYGSHFLYQILGGADEAERRRRARMFGSQGTHFLTNLYTSGTLYLFVNPSGNKLSAWFFAPPSGKETAPIYAKKLSGSAVAYANLLQRRCLVRISESARAREEALLHKAQRPVTRIINPQKVSRAFVCATSSDVRQAAQRISRELPSCNVTCINNPAVLGQKLHDYAFVLFIDEGALAFFDRTAFKEKNPFGYVVLLSYDLRVGCAPTREEVERVCPMSTRADLIFYINSDRCRPAKVMPAAMRYVEDSHNIEYHKKVKRFIFLVVDDELRWFSRFLPVLYRIIGQRAGVMTARTYEEARAIMDEHGSDVVCLITDMLFPMNGQITAEAGRELVLATKRQRPRIPIIVASKADQGRELQDQALILPKGDPDTVEILDQYVHDFTGLGDFLLYRGKKLLRRASTLPELREAVAEAPIEILEEYAEKDYFSTWLYMHGFKSLADHMAKRHDFGEHLREVLVTSFDQEIAYVQEMELAILDEQGNTIAKVRAVTDLARAVEEIDAEVLERNTARDVFSMWLMRKGYPELADKLRPIHGEGDELREEMLAILRSWRPSSGDCS
jgi:hypothetical protein